MDKLTLVIPAKNESESLPIVLNELKSLKAKVLDINSNDFSFCIEFPIKAKFNGSILSSIPSYERSRIAGVKKVNEFRDGFLILISILRILFFRK